MPESSFVQPAGITLDRLAMSFPGATAPVLEQLSLEIESGRITAILGPSGCGKSTALRLIANLLRPTSGSVRFTTDAIETTQLQTGKLAVVFQDAALIPWRNTLQNVMLPMELLGGYSPADRRRLAGEQLRRMGLEDHQWQKRPAQLSGGMRMRVSIARALVTDPSVLLLDEPFAALDDMLRARLGEMVTQLWRDRPRTIVLVTHNIAEAILLSHRIVVMGYGRVAECIPSNLPQTVGIDPRTTPEFNRLYTAVSAALRSAVGGRIDC
jgi:NitT/TauT family transport system ATP-binding protein